MKIKNWGMTLLAVWLIVTGALAIVPISIPFIGIILGVVAVASGILILLNK